MVLFSEGRVHGAPTPAGHAIGRSVAVAAGALLLGAVAMKLLSPSGFVAAVAFAVSPIVAPDPSFARVLAVSTVALETMLGALLLLGGGRLAYLAAAALFVAFSFVLLARFTGSAAPPCACLGRLLSPGKGAVWIDIARNIALALALLLVLPSRSDARPSPRAARRPAKPATDGFTLVELLVTVGAVAVLAALFFPALASANRTAKHTESIAKSRQIVTVLRAYGSDHREYFPAFANAGAGTGGPVLIRGQKFAVGYFRAHMVLWPAAVSVGDPTVLPGTRHPMIQQAPLRPDHPEDEETLFLMTAATAAAPELFTAGTAHPYPPTLLGHRRWSDVVHPAMKGLILDGYWYGRRRHSVALAAFCDGSAAQIPATPAEEVAAVPEDGPHAPVISTIGGLRGRDR